MRTKPGAGFGFQPKDTLTAQDTPTPSVHEHLLRPSPQKGQATLASKTRQELAESFCELVRSTTAVPPASLISSSSLAKTMARSRSASFSDDDLMIVSSQALSSQGADSQGAGGFMSSPLHPISAPNDVIDITSSPAAAAASPSKNRANIDGIGGSGNATTSQPVFGRPTQLVSPVAPGSAAATMIQRRQNLLFNTNRNRPEHHRPQRLTGPLAPKQPDRKAAPRPVFSSLGSSQPTGGTAYPVSSYYNNNSNKASTPKPATSTYADVDFYTDPDKAVADLKALLEGGMEDDDDDDDGEANDKTRAEAKMGQEAAVEEKKKEKKVVEGLEDGAIDGIKVKLLPHQVEGVQWMKGRELGPVKRGRVPKGGILADDMGLGKTLQAISLIVTNPKPARDAPGWKKHYESINGSTLVVAPLALIRQWEAEIKEKVSEGKLPRVCVHHGPQRTVRPKDLAQFDVVITTYQILVSEHNHSNDSLKSGCFGVNWYRVILDEAHSIKNRNAKMTKACCALSAEFRWCLTGTPMQNNLDELQSLVNFLRITPYNNLAEWRAHIDAPMKNGRGYLAIRRLHSLLRCFMKRRTKDILKEDGALLPGGKKALDAAAAAATRYGTASGDSGASTPAVATPAAPSFKITERNVVSVSAEFSPAERRFYDRLEERADKSLQKMIKGKAMSYANALVLLLRLRQACNHPKLLNLKLEKDKDALSTDPVPASQKSTATEGDIDSLADAFGSLGIQAKKCEVCMTDLTNKEQEECDPNDGLVCASCLADRNILNDASPSLKKSKKHRERKKHTKSGGKGTTRERKSKASKDDDNDVISTRRSQRKPRNRRAIIDSDDEDDNEEDDGSWLVGEEERGALHLGKAGGREDEDAEGGGDWINSDDSICRSEDEDDASRLSSFVVDDERSATAKSKTSHMIDRDEDSDDVDDDDSGSDTDSDTSTNSDSGISESEFLSMVDEDSFLGTRRLKSKSSGRRKSPSSHVMVSAKIRKMLSILQAEAAQHKFIVFSQFTSMLDLVEPFLDKAGLGHVRYDGGMRNDAREASLDSLRHNPATRILLCSLKCGALGLNLTAATRVVILEPFWNPFVEEQAIDRVHRLTQTVDVTVYKLTVADTVEQRILELQEKKRLLAAHALEGGNLSGKGKKNALKLGLEELMNLFKHDARGGAEGEELGTGAIGEQAKSDLRGLANLLERRDGSRKENNYKSAPDSVYGRRW